MGGATDTEYDTKEGPERDFIDIEEESRGDMTDTEGQGGK